MANLMVNLGEGVTENQDEYSIDSSSNVEVFSSPSLPQIALSLGRSRLEKNGQSRKNA